MNSAVIFAGGTGSRMNSKILPKQFLKIYGKPVIIHTLEVFENCDEINEIIVVILKGWEQYLQNLLEQYRITKVKKVVTGGSTGQESIYNGLKEVNGDIVLIHDGVRPFISSKLIKENIDVARISKIAITCVKAKETLVSVENNKISGVLERDISYMARAPQTFDVKLLKSAHRKAISENNFSFIDSCAIVKHYFPESTFNIVECGSENIKITTQEDFYLAKAMFSLEEDEQLYGFRRGDEKE
ncbi:2-C-methyl-D-erythritol 4-phosphate cytidylyltransferase [Pasteurella langaaensis DSM 22999]|uniref:2-C-methyl-D-erythritol 4-phosphate cytidylyltransferase n=1 Tax=Alitibacter langaaensis DSM 22999 TaxID=1122935 RepID=A0A2U0TH94_9PAST|nr:IspD/TarI family cytidylyltransferase [Pasteurella langaaensis]PVX42957.1 2-C-methyl-D-erythritol 4-phosphate cytidylyltransferase [Pasteurella langaaensis DSM 22999]